MLKLMAFCGLVAAVLVTGAHASPSSDGKHLVNFKVGGLIQNQPTAGKMMYVITYKNITTKDLKYAVVTRGYLPSGRNIPLSFNGITNVHRFNSGHYMTPFHVVKAGQTKKISVFANRVANFCYNASVHISLGNDVFKLVNWHPPCP